MNTVKKPQINKGGGGGAGGKTLTIQNRDSNALEKIAQVIMKSVMILKRRLKKYLSERTWR